MPSTQNKISIIIIGSARRKLIKKVILLFLFLTYPTIKAQNSTVLSEQLWKQVQDCYTMFEDMDEDGKIDYDEVIDDAKNGYIKVSGSFPTCGCRCENTVGAYRTKSNTYTFIKEYFWPCSWNQGISSNENLTHIFPFDFEVDGFFQKRVHNPDQIATFYLDFEIPRNGTDTRVTLKPIPLGLVVKSEKSIEFGYSEGNRSPYSDQLYAIQNIISQLKDDMAIAYILENDFSRITEEDSQVIHKIIGVDYGQFENKEVFAKVVRELKQIYDKYQQIKYEYLVLGWDANTGNFYIKEKRKRTDTYSFFEFLKRTQVWAPLC